MVPRSPEDLLFTDLEGNRAQLQDVIADGLDGGYEDRIPELEHLLRTGSPYHRVMACVILTAWGQPSGFQTLIEWASDPATTPWANAPVTHDRIHGVDDAFENLADALKTSFWNEATPELRKMQREAAVALLKIYPDYFFDRTLALALVRDKTMPEALESQISAAIEASLQALRSGRNPGFDLAHQTASLILPVALANDVAAARFSDQVASLAPDNVRMLREVALSLATGTGDATRRCLERLKQLGKPSVTEEVDRALARRKAALHGD